jgi:hypothetical protein
MLPNGRLLIAPTGILDVEKSSKVANLFISIGFATSLLNK